jgi:hypothetical protein
LQSRLALLTFFRLSESIEVVDSVPKIHFGRALGLQAHRIAMSLSITHMLLKLTRVASIDAFVVLRVASLS